MNTFKSVSLNSLISLFFLIGIFCLPLNSDPPIVMQLLGEYRNESAGMFFLICFGLLLCRDMIRGRIAFPIRQQPYLLYAVFLIFLFISFAFNITEISNNYFKGTNGILRFIKQMISIVLISIIIFYVFYNVVLHYGAKNAFLKVRQIMWYSLILVGSYATIEILIIYLNMHFLLPITQVYNIIPFVQPEVDFLTYRLMGLTYEPPAFGTFLITIAGFMFSYIFTNKGIKRFLPFGLVVFFAIMSRSRAAFVIIIIQIIMGFGFAYFTVPRFRYWANRISLIIGILVIGVVAFNTQEVYEMINERIADLNFLDRSYDNTLSISNKSRLGIQYANLQVFLNNPIIGVGWGQQTYNAIAYYPSWAKFQNWEFPYKYLNQDHAPFPPGYNFYIRLLAETGIIGTLLFLVFIATFVARLIKGVYTAISEEKYLYFGLFITIVGSLINWFQTDTLRQYGFWLCLAIFMVLKKSDRQISNEYKG